MYEYIDYHTHLYIYIYMCTHVHTCVYTHHLPPYKRLCQSYGDLEPTQEETSQINRKY